ncbi:hypothetical protein [uncultured Roseibium sp.]
MAAEIKTRAKRNSKPDLTLSSESKIIDRNSGRILPEEIRG